MYRNINLVKNSLDVIKYEIKAELLLGTQLARDQINFLYEILDSIYKSPAKHLLMIDYDVIRKPVEGEEL
jgi:hypothetical protein